MFCIPKLFTLICTIVSKQDEMNDTDIDNNKLKQNMQNTQWFIRC